MDADSRRDLPQDVLINCFGLASAVNRAQKSGCFVVVDQGLRLLFVSCQTGLHGFHVVVSAMNELRFRMEVADVVVPRRLEIDVVNLATGGTVSTSGHTLFEQLAWHVDQDRNDSVALLSSQLFETDGLRRSPRKAV